MPNVRAYTMRNEAWEILKTVAFFHMGSDCAKCGRNCEKQLGLRHLDHIFPKSIWKDRILDPENVQVLCADCNRIKGVNSSDYRSEFIRSKAFQDDMRTAFIDRLAATIENQKKMLLQLRKLPERK